MPKLHQHVADLCAVSLPLFGQGIFSSKTPKKELNSPFYSGYGMKIPGVMKKKSKNVGSTSRAALA
jgi:hypothetical protein